MTEPVGLSFRERVKERKRERKKGERERVIERWKVNLSKREGVRGQNRKREQEGLGEDRDAQKK